MRILLTVLLLLSSVAVTPAAVEWEQRGNLQLDAPLVDMVSSADGQRIFALLKGGKVVIFDATGAKQESLDLEFKAERIAVTPRGEQLILSKGKEVRLVALDYIKTIDITGSPFKGPTDAKVVVAVYSDFQ